MLQSCRTLESAIVACGSGLKIEGIGWVLPLLSNSWIIMIIIILWLYIYVNRTPNLDCYGGGGGGGQYPRYRAWGKGPYLEGSDIGTMSAIV